MLRWSPDPPIAGRWVELHYTGAGDVLFWRVPNSAGPFTAVALDGYGAARWRVPIRARSLYVMDWDSSSAAPPVAGEGQVTIPVVPDLRV